MEQLLYRATLLHSIRSHFFLYIFGEEEIGATENFLRDSYLCTGTAGQELQCDWRHVLNPGTWLFCVLRTFHQFSYSSVTQGDNPSCCKSWWASVASAHVHTDLSKHEVVQQIRGGPEAFQISCREKGIAQKSGRDCSVTIMIRFRDGEHKLGVPAAEVTSDVAKAVSGLWPGPRKEERYKFRGTEISWWIRSLSLFIVYYCNLTVITLFFFFTLLSVKVYQRTQLYVNHNLE